GAAAARRRRDRPAPAGHAFPRLRAARGHHHRHASPGIPRLAAEGRRRLPRRAQRDRDRERAGRSRGRARHDLSAQRRLRAACAGTRAFPGQARRKDRRHRHQHHGDRGRIDARFGAAHHRPRPYRGRLADRACRRDPLAAAHRQCRRRASALDPHGLRAARRGLRRRRPAVAARRRRLWIGRRGIMAPLEP
ncbi:hypothetical protein KXW38_000455, partial [Aspergillus fumigatus]